MDNLFLVIGAGAIGTYLGISLAVSGERVVFLEKENDIPWLKERGLSMTQDDECIKLTDPEFTSDLDILREEDFCLVILALKTYHLSTILPQLIELKTQLPPLLCLQNGVESEKFLAKALGEDLVIPGTVTSAIDRLEKGKIIVRKSRGMGIAGDHHLARSFQAVFDQAGLNCRYYPEAEGMKWSKLITNLLGNASSAILNLPPSAIYAHPDLYRLELEQVREALEVMRAQRIPVVNLPGVPVRILAGIVRTLPAGISQPLLSKLIGKGRGEKMPSFHIDLYSKRGSSEVGQLNGAVVRAGERLGLAAPVNGFLTSRLLDMMEGRIPLNLYQNQLDLFLEDLARHRTGRPLTG